MHIQQSEQLDQRACRATLPSFSEAASSSLAYAPNKPCSPSSDLAIHGPAEKPWSPGPVRSLCVPYCRLPLSQ